MISAEIPDRNTHPLLYETVSNNMMHGPCGHLNPSSPCMVDGSCSKRFPKAFNEETIVPNGERGSDYPEYRRRQDRKAVQKGTYAALDNR